MIIPLSILLSGLARADVPEEPQVQSCEALADGWASLEQALAARPLEERCVTDDGAATTAASVWHDATREAAHGALGVPGCAQVLGEPTTREDLESALQAVEVETTCVDVDGVIATLRPMLAPGEAVPRTLDRWQPRMAQYPPCSADVAASPCVDERGVLRADPTFLKARVRPMPRLRREVRRGMSAENLGTFDATVHLEVDERGRVAALEWTEGPAWAEDSVTRALSRWRFEPVTVDGEPTPAAVDLTVRLSEN